MVGTHQSRFPPIEAGPADTAESLVHIPHGQSVGIGKAADGLHGNRGAGINLISTPARMLMSH